MVLFLVIGCSLGIYLSHRRTGGTPQVFGSADSEDHVEVSVWISHLDTGSQTMLVEITEVAATGALADTAGDLRRAAQLEVPTALGENRVIQLDPGKDTPDTEWRFAITGTVTDYPFDVYRSALVFRAATADGTPLPIAISITSADPFFRVDAAMDTQNAGTAGGVEIDVTSERATPTMVFAFFVMLLMLGLAAAAATAAYYLLRWRRGLNFPACSMMAAILFALIPLRNAVPGNPPIGSVIDFVSFFVAEIIISISLVASVLIGYRTAMAQELSALTPSSSGAPVKQ
ncbi:DUF4436 domain-containing protein [Mycobacterium sp. CBMA271]|nr:DUF4436 domain-containing protein [Mycobacteroides sp. CBMA 271]